MSRRFSKANLLADLEKRAEFLRERNSFKPGNGWAQVKNSGTERIVEYGRYCMLQDLIEELS
jgi:hypothetical protein